MHTITDYARAFERGFRRLLPPRLKRLGKDALLRLINPRKELPSFLGRRTLVVSLVAKTKEGLIAFDVRDQVVGWAIAFDGEWEREESDRLRTIVKSGDLAIDVGANIGWYTLMLSQLVGDTGLVLAFEPEPRNFELLSTNVKLNGRENRVRTFELALLSEDREVEFELSDQNFGDHRIRLRSPDSPREAELYAESTRRVTRVRARSLDAVVEAEQLGSRVIKLLKIDCQGAEATIVDGAARTLARTAYLAIEYWPYGIRRAGFDPLALIRTLARRFDSFAVLHDAPGLTAFQPTSALEAHASAVREHTDYLFRNSELAQRAEQGSVV